MGVRPLHRRAQFRMTARRRTKMDAKKNWFRKNKVDSEVVNC